MSKNNTSKTPSKKMRAKKVKNQKPTAKKAFKVKYIGWILAGIVTITYLLAMFSLLKTNLLPTKYLFLIIIVSLCVIAGVVVANLRYHWRLLAKSVLLVAISLLVALANSYILIVTQSTNSFFNNIDSQEYSLESYSIVAKEPNLTSVKKSQTIGYLTDDPNSSAILEIVSKKTKASQIPLNELASLTVALEDKNVDTIVLRSGLLQLLEQNYPSFYQDLKVLEKFDVKVKSKNIKKTDITRPYAVFLGGIDTYGNIDSVSRSDVNIVAVINPQTRKVLLINTPRDYYVQLHSTTGIRDKLTHAGIYGVDMSRQTLEDLYGIPIDYSVRINFTSLLKIIDKLGTVIVYSDNDFTSGGYTFEKGYNQLDSKQALEFSRNRKSFENGDRSRGENQQRVIEAIIEKLNDPRSLIKYQSIVQALGDSFQTNASSSEISAILKQQMNTLGSWQTESISVDGTDSSNSTYSMGAMKLYVMEPDIESINKAKIKIQELKQNY
jgi:LCP family protein required for cell wall assembly